MRSFLTVFFVLSASFVSAQVDFNLRTEQTGLAPDVQNGTVAVDVTAGPLENWDIVLCGDLLGGAVISPVLFTLGADALIMNNGQPAESVVGYLDASVGGIVHSVVCGLPGTAKALPAGTDQEVLLVQYSSPVPVLFVAFCEVLSSPLATETRARLSLAGADATVTNNTSISLLFGPGPGFLRGDCNNDGSVNNTDVICNLNWQFQQGAGNPCLDALDVDGNGLINVGDPTYLLNFLFLGGTPPAFPYPVCDAPFFLGYNYPCVDPGTCP